MQTDNDMRIMICAKQRYAQPPMICASESLKRIMICVN